jgi:aspartyl/asparaginyl-tRNA synthetase
MERTLIKDLAGQVGKEVQVSGRVFNIRKLGAVYFVLIRDYTGLLQVVFKTEVEVKIGDAVTIKGVVRADARAKSGVELGGESIVARYGIVEEMPFDISKNNLNLNLDTLLVNRDPDHVTTELIGAPFAALGELPAEAFAESECPLCAQNIPINTSVGHGKKYLDSKQK